MSKSFLFHFSISSWTLTVILLGKHSSFLFIQGSEVGSLVSGAALSLGRHSSWLITEGGRNFAHWVMICFGLSFLGGREKRIADIHKLISA